MNKAWLIAWLDSDLWLRILSFFSLAALLLLAFWQLGVRPVQQTSLQLKQQIDAQTNRYYQQRRPLLALPPLALISQRLIELRRPAAAGKNQPFSVPVLLAEIGAELERWQPAERGGELVLNLDWQQFVRLLDFFIAEHCSVKISTLTLQGTSPRLQLLMGIENES